MWQEIREHVAAIGAECSEPWIADDVFHELLVGNANLWALDDATGFVVLRVFATGYRRELHVWLAWNATDQTCRDYFPQLVGIAQANDCEGIHWESPRRWERALPGTKVRYSYSYDLGERE